MTPPSTAAEQRGRAFLFQDVDPLAALFSPQDKLIGAAARGMLGLTPGQIREIWRPGVFSPRMNAQLATVYEPAARAMEQFPGLSIRTLGEFYREIVGRPFETARAKEDVLVTSTYPKAHANVVNLAMLRMYRHRRQQFGIPSALCRFGRTTNTRPQQTVTLGAFASGLPVVAENALYGDLPVLLEQGTTFSMTKLGGLVRWSIEMQTNDRADLLGEIGRAIGEAGALAVAQACWSLWTSNSTAGPDGTAWHSVAHANLATGALAGPALVDALKKLAAQIPLGGALAWPSPIVRGSVYLIVHPSVFDLALTLNQTAGTSYHWLFGESNEYIIQNPLVTAPMWGVTRAAGDVPSVVINFMDGDEAPTLDLADEPNSGNVFSNDQYTFKCRLWFGVGLVEWRASVQSPGA